MSECNAINLLLDSAMKMNQERRKSTRVELTARVKLTLEDGVIEGELVNISLHGAFVMADRPVAANTQVTITISDTEMGRGIIGLKGKVVRVAGNGLGLEFETRR